MKTSNILAISLLCVTGSLFGRLDLQKVAKWKKEDSTTWTQAKVDEILKHINHPANKKGNEPLLKPLFDRINNWRTEQARIAEARRVEAEAQATRARLAAAEERARIDAENARRQAREAVTRNAAEATRRQVAEAARRADVAARNTAEAARLQFAEDTRRAEAAAQAARQAEAQREQERITAQAEVARLEREHREELHRTVGDQASQVARNRAEARDRAQAELKRRQQEEAIAEAHVQETRTRYKDVLGELIAKHEAELKNLEKQAADAAKHEQELLRQKAQAKDAKRTLETERLEKERLATIEHLAQNAKEQEEAKERSLKAQEQAAAEAQRTADEEKKTREDAAEKELTEKAINEREMALHNSALSALDAAIKSPSAPTISNLVMKTNALTHTKLSNAYASLRKSLQSIQEKNKVQFKTDIAKAKEQIQKITEAPYKAVLEKRIQEIEALAEKHFAQADAIEQAAEQAARKQEATFKEEAVELLRQAIVFLKEGKTFDDKKLKDTINSIPREQRHPYANLNSAIESLRKKNFVSYDATIEGLEETVLTDLGENEKIKDLVTLLEAQAPTFRAQADTIEQAAESAVEFRETFVNDFTSYLNQIVNTQTGPKPLTEEQEANLERRIQTIGKDTFPLAQEVLDTSRFLNKLIKLQQKARQDADAKRTAADLFESYATKIASEKKVQNQLKHKGLKEAVLNKRNQLKTELRTEAITKKKQVTSDALTLEIQGHSAALELLA